MLQPQSFTRVTRWQYFYCDEIVSTSTKFISSFMKICQLVSKPLVREVRADTHMYELDKTAFIFVRTGSTEKRNNCIKVRIWEFIWEGWVEDWTAVLLVYKWKQWMFTSILQLKWKIIRQLIVLITINKSLVTVQHQLITLAYLVQRQSNVLQDLRFSRWYDVAPCSLVEVYQRFRTLYCLHHQGDDGDRPS
jgi:hypothetical protein